MPYQRPSEAERAMNEGSVIATDREASDYLPLKHNPDRCLLGKGHGSIIDLLRQEEGNLEFDPPRLGNDFALPAKFD
jgi:hypothetical protein